MKTGKPSRKKIPIGQLESGALSVEEIGRFFNKLTPKQAREVAITIGIMTADGELTAKFRQPRRGVPVAPIALKRRKSDPWAAFRAPSEEELRCFYGALTREEAIQAGIRAGILTPSGRLTASYRQPKLAAKKRGTGDSEARPAVASPEPRSPEVARLEEKLRRYYSVDPEEAVRAAKRAGILTRSGKLSRTYR